MLDKLHCYQIILIVCLYSSIAESYHDHMIYMDYIPQIATSNFWYLIEIMILLLYHSDKFKLGGGNIMKSKNYGKLILLTMVAISLAVIPIRSNAATRYSFVYGTPGINSLNTTVIRLNNNCYTVVRNQDQTTNSYYTIAKKQNQTTNNYYVVSRGNYLRLTSQPQPILQPQPVPQLQPAPEPQPAPRPEPNTGTDPNTGDISGGKHSLTSEEIQMVDYVNKARQEAGLQPLQVDPDLARIARLKSQDMCNNNYFSHDSPTYGSPFEMMTKFEIGRAHV